MVQNKTGPLSTPSRAASHRQLRVGEEIRHILADLFLRAEFPKPGFPVPVTITQVKMSPDLQNATVFVMPLGGEHRKEVIAYLQKISGYIRHQLGKGIHLKFTPALKFLLDESFDQAQRLEKVFKTLDMV